MTLLPAFIISHEYIVATVSVQDRSNAVSQLHSIARVKPDTY